ncbi:MAG: hypothetical protein LBT05_03765 [Planctomycetaceae bacterium]|nr:hypothetical protein [Planctomycetaceae bacterium]
MKFSQRRRQRGANGRKCRVLFEHDKSASLARVGNAKRRRSQSITQPINNATLFRMDEKWSFYRNKKRQIWLWQAIDHDSGETVAFWFGTRKHLDKFVRVA